MKNKLNLSIFDKRRIIKLAIILLKESAFKDYPYNYFRKHYNISICGLITRSMEIITHSAKPNETYNLLKEIPELKPSFYWWRKKLYRGYWWKTGTLTELTPEQAIKAFDVRIQHLEKVLTKLEKL